MQKTVSVKGTAVTRTAPDRIEIAFTADDRLAEALESCAEMIQKGTLALKLERAEAGEGFTAKEWDINDRKAVLAVRKV